MGYAYAVYAVDLNSLRATFGCKDEALYATLCAEYADDLKENASWFEDDIADGAPTLARALRDLLWGEPKVEHGFQYGYAAELLCRHLGERVDDLELASFDEVADPLLRVSKTSELLGRGVMPMTFPAPEDFPEIGTVEAEACEHSDGMFAYASLMTDDDNARTVMEAVGRWFDRAQELKRGLVSFLY